MGYACGRKSDSAPIHELFQLTLNQNELAFIYLGFAGIILKVNDRVLAFDVGKECLHQDEIEALEHLDVQFYSHTHSMSHSFLLEALRLPALPRMP